MSLTEETETVFLVSQRYGRNNEPTIIGVYAKLIDAKVAADTAHLAYKGNGEPARSKNELGMHWSDYADQDGYPFIWIREHALRRSA
jgi:hypothetical protein